MNLALFDLDHTLIPIDSDYEWGQFLCRIGAVDADEFSRRNADFYAQYQQGTLDPVEYLEFALGTLAAFDQAQLNAWHAQFMQEVIQPALRASAFDLLKKHQDKMDDSDFFFAKTSNCHFNTVMCFIIFYNIERWVVTVLSSLEK